MGTQSLWRRSGLPALNDERIWRGSGFKGRIWIVLVVVPIILIMLAAVRWSLDHPYGFCWDEAEYINQSYD